MSLNRVDFKIVVLGSENCGKTSLVEKFLFNKSVTEEYSVPNLNFQFQSLLIVMPKKVVETSI